MGVFAPSDIRKAADRIRTSTYEVASRCNLKCEGCLFFSGEHAHEHADEADGEAWRRFFRKESERGITYAFLAGAEPALEPDRVRAAWEFIPAGMVVTNGTRRLPEDVGFRIHVSLWGDGKTSAVTRGADVVGSALRNYAHDPRAVFVFTINPLNIGEIQDMAGACADHGVPMTFNYYSPTERYRAEVTDPRAEETDYFRLGEDGRAMIMGAADYARARAAIERARACFPDTIIYSLAYDDWVTVDEVYALDDRGIAYNCAARSDRVHGTFFVDQRASDLKCSNPTFDCRDCRTYASGMTSHVRLEYRNALRASARGEVSEAFDCWSHLFVGDQWARINARFDAPTGWTEEGA